MNDNKVGSIMDNMGAEQDSYREWHDETAYLDEELAELGIWPAPSQLVRHVSPPVTLAQPRKKPITFDEIL